MFKENVPQEKNVGGHIDLSDASNDVFIEIDTEVAKHNDAVLATLAHELSHKILAINILEQKLRNKEQISKINLDIEFLEMMFEKKLKTLQY